MTKLLGNDFCFVSTMPMEQERVDMEWELKGSYQYELRAYVSQSAKEKAMNIANSSDVVIIGSASDAISYSLFLDREKFALIKDISYAFMLHSKHIQGQQRFTERRLRDNNSHDKFLRFLDIISEQFLKDFCFLFPDSTTIRSHFRLFIPTNNGGKYEGYSCKYLHSHPSDPEMEHTPFPRTISWNRQSKIIKAIMKRTDWGTLVYSPKSGYDNITDSRWNNFLTTVPNFKDNIYMKHLTGVRTTRSLSLFLNYPHWIFKIKKAL